MKIKIFLWGGVFLLPFLLLSQTIPYQDGWPVEIEPPSCQSIYIIDIDKDNNKELIMMGRGDNYQNAMLYAFENNGTIINNFPIAGGNFFNGNPSFLDINDDGKYEIAVTIARSLYLIDSNGNILWNEPYNGPIFQSKFHPFHLSVDDLDNDGIKEIVVTTYSGGAVFVFEPDGSLRAGWPVLNIGVTHVSASIGDIDKDGIKEIIAATTSGLFCFKPDGSICEGFPFGNSSEYKSFSTKPILIDLYQNGYLEILFATTNIMPPKIALVDHTGNLIPPYPLYNVMYESCVGKIYEDNRFAFLYAYGSIYAYDIETATLLSNFPINPITDGEGTWSFGGNKGPNICNLSDDFGKEIIVGAASGSFVYDGKLFAFNLQGQVVDGFPSQFLYHRGLTTGCSVDDLDGDGDVEICCGSENTEWVTPRHSNVFCWDSPHPWNRDNADWMMDGFDLQNTGRWRKLYHIDKIQSTIEVIGCTTNPCILPPDGNLYEVKITAKRKFAEEYPKGQDVRYARTLGCGNFEGPAIDNQDGTYIRYLRAPTTECSTTIEGWVNEFKIDSCVEITFTDCLGNLGDINLNGEINSMDSSFVLQKVVEAIEFTTAEFCRADVNRNGKITSIDASLILQCSVGLCSNLPAEFFTSCTSHSNCP